MGRYVTLYCCVHFPSRQSPFPSLGVLISKTRGASMFHPRHDSHSSNNFSPFLPPRKRLLLTRRRLFVLISPGVFVSLFLLSQILSNWSFLFKPTLANSSSTGGLTYQQYASEGRPNNIYHGPAIIPANSPSRHKPPKGPFTDYSKLPPSV